MAEHDETMREALRRESDALAADVNEPGLVDMVMEVFRGRTRHLTLLGAFWGVVIMALAALCAVQFFRAGDDKALIGWATAFLLCMLGIGLLKIWFWMELQRAALTREVKRVELQLARLAERLAAPRHN